MRQGICQGTSRPRVVSPSIPLRGTTHAKEDPARGVASQRGPGQGAKKADGTSTVMGAALLERHRSETGSTAGGARTAEPGAALQAGS